VSGISLTMYGIFTIGVLLWLVYAIALGSWPMMLSNGVTAPVALAILGMKLRYRSAEIPPAAPAT
jgi:MtN3 and saliva related transmembrane protein